jgi:hypothetical protein
MLDWIIVHRAANRYFGDACADLVLQAAPCAERTTAAAG